MMGNWEYEIVVSLCLETVPKELCFFFYFFRILRKATGIQEVKEEMVNIACNCSLFAHTSPTECLTFDLRQH